jgi:8-oxo-dGTP pyrophosphatase MutT (NUDIX family)
VSSLIKQLRRQLDAYSPEDLWTDASLFSGEAAVLIGVTDHSCPDIILTKRSESLSSHRGEVALPGGRIDPEDEDAVQAALRESQEEIALNPEQVEVLGSLDPMVTRFGMKVTPVVGVVEPEVDLIPNPDELDAVFRVPLEFLLEDRRLRTDVGTLGGYKVQVPCWEYEGYEIWGVTAVILTMMMNRVFDRGIETGMEKILQQTGGKYMPQDWRKVKGRKGITE